MLTIEQIVSKLADSNISKVARTVGIPRTSIYGLINGTAKKPLYETIKALSEYFEKR